MLIIDYHKNKKNKTKPYQSGRADAESPNLSEHREPADVIQYHEEDYFYLCSFLQMPYGEQQCGF